jgi:hypothetical protein
MSTREKSTSKIESAAPSRKSMTREVYSCGSASRRESTKS